MHEDRLHREAQVEAEHQLADVVPPAALSVESVLEMVEKYSLPENVYVDSRPIC